MVWTEGRDENSLLKSHCTSSAAVVEQFLIQCTYMSSTIKIPRLFQSWGENFPDCNQLIYIQDCLSVSQWPANKKIILHNIMCE